MEVVLRDGIPFDRVPQGAGDEARRPALVAIVQFVAPGSQLVAFVVEGAGLVGNVIAVTAEGIDAVDGGAFVGGQEQKGVVKIPGLLAGHPSTMRQRLLHVGVHPRALSFRRFAGRQNERSLSQIWVPDTIATHTCLPGTVNTRASWFRESPTCRPYPRHLSITFTPCGSN